MKMKSIFKTLISAMSITAFADSAVTVVTSEGTAQNGGVLFSDAVRTVYSKEIEFKAMPVMRFAQFATEKTELGVEAGLTISMLTYNNLKLGGKLTENSNLTTQALSGVAKQITVTEYGNAISVSELAIQSSFDDIMASATALLGRDYALTIDCLLRDTALSGTNVVYAKNGVTPVTARKDLTENCTLKVSTIKDAIEILSTNNAPKAIGGSSWVAFVHPHQSRGLRDDSAWINASNYGAPEQLFNGEIGRIDDCRFIETTLMCNGACSESDPAYKEELTKGYNSEIQTPIYQAVVFGDAYYGLATSLPVELRTNGVEDFGRTRSLAWYAILGAGKLHNDYGVVIETA